MVLRTGGSANGFEKELGVRFEDVELEKEVSEQSDAGSLIMKLYTPVQLRVFRSVEVGLSS